MVKVQDLVNELYEVQKRIETIMANKDMSPSNSILEERVEIEQEIHRKLIDGGRVKDPVLDYCLRHFAAISSNVNSEDTFTPSALDMIKKVKKFTEYIDDRAGARILTTYGGIPRETGVISGPVKFEIEDTFRHMYVPVDQLYVSDNNGGWIQGKGGLKTNNNSFHITPDIFSHPGFLLGNGIWATNHSGETYIGGSGPEETSIYVGNMKVAHELKKGYNKECPKTTRKIVMRFPGE